MLKTNSNKNDKNRKNTKPIYGSPAIYWHAWAWYYYNFWHSLIAWSFCA